MANPTAKQFAEVLKDIAVNKKSAMLNVLTAAVRNRVSLLKDYLNASFALLGGSLTVLTVKPALAKTVSLLYVGSLTVLVGVVLNFMARRSYMAQEENQLNVIEVNFAAVITAVNNSITADTEDKKYDFLQQGSSHIDQVAPPVPKFYQFADKYLGLILLFGGLCIAVSLLFRISI